MKRKSKATAVKGGLVLRDAKTGRFVSVKTSNGVNRAKPKSLSAVKSASAKRKVALKRLANR